RCRLGERELVVAVVPNDLLEHGDSLRELPDHDPEGIARAVVARLDDHPVVLVEVDEEAAQTFDLGVEVDRNGHDGRGSNGHAIGPTSSVMCETSCMSNTTDDVSAAE